MPNKPQSEKYPSCKLLSGQLLDQLPGRQGVGEGRGGLNCGPATWTESGLANLAGAGQAWATRQTWLATCVVELGRRSGLRGGAGAAGAVTRRGQRCRCGAALAAARGSRPPPRGPEPAPGSCDELWGLMIDQAPRRPRSLHASTELKARAAPALELEFARAEFQGLIP